MTDRAEELEAAAKDIDLESLQAAKSAVAASCQEYIRWADLFSRRLETVEAAELHKFARAFSLTLLGHLPTRPGTCPFCIQYDRDRAAPAAATRQRTAAAMPKIPPSASSSRPSRSWGGRYIRIRAS